LGATWIIENEGGLQRQMRIYAWWQIAGTRWALSGLLAL
jgi:hypothetical protein